MKELHSVTGHGRYVFPRAQCQDQCSTDERKHGQRGTAETLFNEQGWPADAIERQLSHGERDEVRG
ncbi:hypothetical protein DWV00_11680 [Trinickia dinghuensis]|uniref:Integrase n=1 Tax=Trinickia dinghuensis TaxID=2291023 RepID=A0A3D8K0G6_9BURK|nr:hypothetical protein DWV00_11680 [Trinickia dinghuensis]